MHPLPVVLFWNQEAFIVQISSSSHTKVNNFLLFDFYLETLLETYSTHLVLDYCSTTNTGCWLQHMPSHDFNTRSQTGPILFIYLLDLECISSKGSICCTIHVWSTFRKSACKCKDWWVRLGLASDGQEVIYLAIQSNIWSKGQCQDWHPCELHISVSPMQFPVLFYCILMIRLTMMINTHDLNLNRSIRSFSVCVCMYIGSYLLRAIW